MSATISKGVSHKSLTEAITLLYLLNEFPESAQDNQPPPVLSAHSTSYQLSLQREKEIVDHLAFLSATTDDSASVTAVCLEEARDHGSCIIRLSSNTGNVDQIVLGFKLMAKMLEQARSRGLHAVFNLT